MKMWVRRRTCTHKRWVLSAGKRGRRTCQIPAFRRSPVRAVKHAANGCQRPSARGSRCWPSVPVKKNGRKKPESNKQRRKEITDFRPLSLPFRDHRMPPLSGTRRNKSCNERHFRYAARSETHHFRQCRHHFAPGKLQQDGRVDTGPGISDSPRLMEQNEELRGGSQNS